MDLSKALDKIEIIEKELISLKYTIKRFLKSQKDLDRIKLMGRSPNEKSGLGFDVAKSGLKKEIVFKLLPH